MADSTAAPNVMYPVWYSSGSTPVVVDQKVNGAPTWNYLGSVTFASGQNHRVELSGQSNGWPSADAIAVVPGDAPGNLATWQPVISVAQDYGLYARWSHGINMDVILIQFRSLKIDRDTGVRFGSFRIRQVGAFNVMLSVLSLDTFAPMRDSII